MRAALSALLILPLVAFAEANGITGYSTKTAGMNCTACHNGGTVPSASISGAPITLNVNTAVTVTVTVTAGSTASTVAGLDVALGGAASADSVLIAGTGTQVMAGELTHTAPQAFDAGLATFTFQVRAGAINGPLTLYMATLAGNGNNATTLDSYYGFNRTITVQGDAGQPVPDSGVIVDPDSGVVIVPDAGSGDAGTVSPGRPGGFVGGDYGCSTGGGFVSGLWMLALGVFALMLQRRKLR